MWFVGSYSIKKIVSIKNWEASEASVEKKKKKILAYPSSVFPLKLGTILNEFK